MTIKHGDQVVIRSEELPVLGRRYSLTRIMTIVAAETEQDDEGRELALYINAQDARGRLHEFERRGDGWYEVIYLPVDLIFGKGD